MNVLIKTTAELKQYSSMDADTEYSTFEPFLEEATTLYLLDLLGTAFHEELFTAYDAPSLSPQQTALLPYIQRTLTNYALFLSVDQLNVRVGDAGIMDNRTQNTEPAPKFKTDALKASYLNQADLHAEKLLEYLEANAADFPTWVSGPGNTAATGLLVATAKVANEYIDINESRRLFKKLIKRIKHIETRYINKLIGQAQYDALVTQIKAATLTPENEALVEILRPIIAKKALIETIPSMLIGLSANGIHIISSNDGTITKSAADQNQLKMLMYNLKDGDTGYIQDVNQLEQFIIDNIADYPLIEASTAYTSRPDPGPKRPYENLSTNKHFGI